MLTPELRERIRRAYYIDHKSFRQIASEVGHSRDTIRRAIAQDAPTPAQQTRQKASRVSGPFQARLEELLERNER